MKSRKLTADTGEYKVFNNFWQLAQQLGDFDNNHAGTEQEWDLIMDKLNEFANAQDKEFVELAGQLALAWGEWLVFKQKRNEGLAKTYNNIRLEKVK